MLETQRQLDVFRDMKAEHWREISMVKEKCRVEFDLKLEEQQRHYQELLDVGIREIAVKNEMYIRIVQENDEMKMRIRC